VHPVYPLEPCGNAGHEQFTRTLSRLKHGPYRCLPACHLPTTNALASTIARAINEAAAGKQTEAYTSRASAANWLSRARPRDFVRCKNRSPCTNPARLAREQRWRQTDRSIYAFSGPFAQSQRLREPSTCLRTLHDIISALRCRRQLPRTSNPMNHV
jgi:hypothetical protein